MAKWDFKIVGASFVKELVPIADDVQPRSQSFMQPSFHLEGGKIVIKESGQYVTAIYFSQIGEIDGVAPTDIDDAYAKLLTLVENFNGGGVTPQTLAETLAEDNKTNEIPILSNSEDGYLYVNDEQTILGNDFGGVKKITISEDTFRFDTTVRFDFESKGINLNTTSDGLGIPRLTTAQMNAISFPTNGMIVWNTTETATYQYNGTSWVLLGGGAVDSVNGQTGVVVLDAADVGAEPTKGSDDNYVTDAQLVVIGNTSGTNSGDNATNTTSNAYADAKVADTIADGVTTVAPSQNAVFDALALKQNNLVLGKKGNASSPVTGTTTETILESIFIPAGSVAVNDIIYIRNRVFKTGATGGFTVRYRINSSNSISGSSVLAFATLGAVSTRSQGLERTLNLRASNTIEVVDNTTSIAYENTSISNANVNITFTFTSDFWILITGQLTGVADSIVNSNYIIQKF